jgi:formamidopyrimidine-DNA glycosylase
MPELPEVQTTVNGLNAEVKGLHIQDVWTDYNSAFHAKNNNIKNSKYFPIFKKEVLDTKITHAERIGKQILLRLSNGKTIFTHMKMTGHFLYGEYVLNNKKWQPKENNSPLSDPYNRHIHLVFSFSNGKQLAFSDARKFATIFVFDTSKEKTIKELAKLGPDSLSSDLSFSYFKERLLKRPRAKIKQTLLDQETIAGIGNIYADEILWTAGVHPLSITEKIPEKKLEAIYRAIKPLLKKGIDFGGTSDSDYRNIYGESGKFQNKHNVYRQAGEKCPKKDGGIIERIVIGARSAHFCPKHQTLFK